VEKELDQPRFPGISRFLACFSRAGAWDYMILTCGFHNFDLTVVKRSLASICPNYVADHGGSSQLLLILEFGIAGLLG